MVDRADQVNLGVTRQSCGMQGLKINHFLLIALTCQYVLTFLVAKGGAVNVVDDEVNMFLLLIHSCQYLGQVVRGRGGAGLHLQHVLRDVAEHGLDGERGKETVDYNRVLPSEVLVVELVEQRLLGAETVCDNVEAAMKKTQPLGEIDGMVL